MNPRTMLLLIVAACLIGTLGVESAPAVPIATTQNAQVNDPPVTESTPHNSTSKLGSEPIRRSNDAAPGSARTIIQPQGLELPRVAGSLALVIGLIFLLRWGGKKLFVPASAGRNTRAVQILSRSSISPRQHILLLRVGRRVIVVGDSGAQMNPLAEINDPDEVATLLGQLQDEKSHLPTMAFQSLFRRAQDEIEDSQPMAGSSPRQVSATAVSDDDGEEAVVDPAVEHTQSEITGLMDKIRGLSSHFRSGST